VAFWHTHLYSDGTTVFCRLRNRTIVVNNAASGGGSFAEGGRSGDWDAVRTDSVSMYTVDPERIYRLDPGTPAGSEADNPNIWFRIPGTCAAR
jgi:hypothetical protein